MLRFLYTLLFHLIQPLVLLRMYYRSLAAPEYRRRLPERYGCYANLASPKPHGIVIHAASVGEVIAATPLIKAIQARYPELAVTITTITPTGSARVKAAFGNSVTHLYLPYDLPFAIRRFLHFIQPKLVVVVETELWPNLIREVAKQNIPFVVANARLSPRSAKRYGKIAREMQRILADVNLILAQDQVSRDRYFALGCPADRLCNTGNLKFDLEISQQLRQQVNETRQALNFNDRLVWIAGSTHDGEEKIVLEAHQKLRETYPDLLLILVPRHPERFPVVENLLKKMAMPYVLRSSKQPLSSDTSVLLGDTMGEMMLLYGLSQIAFVGGSLVKHGGHNPLEPIAFELPVISGVHTFNFPEVFSKLRAVNGVIEVQSESDSLLQAVSFLLNNAKSAEQIRQAGFSVLKENQGALNRHLEKIAPYLDREIK